MIKAINISIKASQCRFRNSFNKVQKNKQQQQKPTRNRNREQNIKGSMQETVKDQRFA